MKTRIVYATLSLTLFFSLCGCKPDPALRKAEVIGKGSLPVTSPTPSGDAGSVKGVVRFEGPAPARTKIDMSMDPACAMSSDENDAEQLVVSGGKLANVYVYVKSGVPASDAAESKASVVLDQRGCRYTPHVIALQQGSKVEFRNSDMTMHNIHTVPGVEGNAGVDVSQGPKGQPQVKTFRSAETMLPVRCNNHPWMNAFINVAPNPYFAVTAADGSFSIPGLPPGTYVLAAVHEKLGEQDISLTVAPRTTAKAEFSFRMK